MGGMERTSFCFYPPTHHGLCRGAPLNKKMGSVRGGSITDPGQYIKLGGETRRGNGLVYWFFFIYNMTILEWD